MMLPDDWRYARTAIRNQVNDIGLDINDQEVRHLATLIVKKVASWSDVKTTETDVDDLVREGVSMRDSQRRTFNWNGEI